MINFPTKSSITAEGHGLSTVACHGEEMLFLDILCMPFTTHTHTLTRSWTVTHTDTRLIIIGWDAWGMCPGKQKTSNRRFGRNGRPKSFNLPSYYFLPFLCNQGVCVFPCLWVGGGAGGGQRAAPIYSPVVSVGLLVRDWETCSGGSADWSRHRSRIQLGRGQDSVNNGQTTTQNESLFSNSRTERAGKSDVKHWSLHGNVIKSWYC